VGNPEVGVISSNDGSEKAGPNGKSPHRESGTDRVNHRKNETAPHINRWRGGRGTTNRGVWQNDNGEATTREGKGAHRRVKGKRIKSKILREGRQKQKK